MKDLFKPDLEMAIGLIIGVFVIPFLLGRIRAQK